MTWKEFKEKVDERLVKLGIDENVNVCWIDVVLYSTDEIDIEYVKDEDCIRVID